MKQIITVENHAEHGLTQVVTTHYSSGAISKRYLDAKGLPFDAIWIKPLKKSLELSAELSKRVDLAVQ